MKVSGPRNISSRPVSKSDGKKRTTGSDFSSKLSDVDAAPSASSVSSAGPITSIDALLSIQEAPDATMSRSKGLARAEEMLDVLEQIRRGILLGAVPMRNLRGLADMARGRKEQVEDPRLAEILEEIELRAEVELAKLGV